MRQIPSLASVFLTDQLMTDLLVHGKSCPTGHKLHTKGNTPKKPSDKDANVVTKHVPVSPRLVEVKLLHSLAIPRFGKSLKVLTNTICCKVRLGDKTRANRGYGFARVSASAYQRRPVLFQIRCRTMVSGANLRLQLD